MKKTILFFVCALSMGAYAQLISGGQITTTTSYQHASDSAKLQINTNVPANLTLDGQDMGETKVTPYEVKFGQHKIVLTAEGYYRRSKTVEVQRSTYTVYNFRLQRKPRRYAIRHGLQQELVLNFDWQEFYHSGNYGGYYDTPTGLIDYVIGWRFNDWVFLGAGTGLHVYRGYTFKRSDHQYAPTDNYRYLYASQNEPYNGYDFDKTLVEMPLYAQLKVYFMNTRWKPFLETSLGGRFGFTSFRDSGIMFNVAPGVEFCINDHNAINLMLGYSFAGHHVAVPGGNSTYYSSEKCSTSCPYKGSYHYHYNIDSSRELAHGLTLRIGFVL